jgi:hypothetical protein
MTTENVARVEFIRRSFAISRLDPPELCQKFPYPRNQRAQGMPDARCTRGPVSKMEKERTRADRFSGGTPTFPAQWLYGLYRALPGDRACLTPSPREDGFVRPVGLAKPPRDLTPTTEASGPHDFAVRSARLRQKASPGKTPFVSAPFDRSQALWRTRPASRFTPDAAASTAPCPASLTIRIRPSVEQDGEEFTGDLGMGSRGISENQKSFRSGKALPENPWHSNSAGA